MKLDPYSNTQIMASLQAAAECEGLFCDEDWLKQYQFHAEWSADTKMGKYDSGGGDEVVLIQKGDMLVIKGFDHESEISPHAQEEYGIWPGIYDGVPEELMEELKDDAIEYEHVTFCFYRTTEAGPFVQPEIDLKGNDDGLGYLLPIIPANVEEYLERAEEYHEEVTPEQVAQVREIYKRFCG